MLCAEGKSEIEVCYYGSLANRMAGLPRIAVERDVAGNSACLAARKDGGELGEYRIGVGDSATSGSD